PLRKWLEQRPRQAYEDFGLRFKTILFASFLPLAVAVPFIAGTKWLSIFALSIFVTMTGWLRGNARKYFPFNICLFTPLWISERPAGNNSETIGHGSAGSRRAVRENFR